MIDAKIGNFEGLGVEPRLKKVAIKTRSGFELAEVFTIFVMILIKDDDAKFITATFIDFEQIEINTGIIEYNFDAVNGLPIEGFQLLGEYNNHYYYKYNTSTSWLDADTLTRANGGYLACLDNQNENDFVWNSFGGNKWIGYYDSNGQ